ncbi:major facilitator superfamily domain-containing protein [Kockovaella imperatae]|uniref:Major facilitator superfamily domain-containing protein n=1 Tax=Kockovaella imperatae TaxID=4999 RepID=A0A1Y1UC63_9TREE|nr:major facilitator superfamily domain-containing protein [Kockovaella imperatae]ORX35086.1 major facilitator superfamily domain-containing protein [Kockovaella imperatae]
MELEARPESPSPTDESHTLRNLGDENIPGQTTKQLTEGQHRDVEGSLAVSGDNSIETRARRAYRWKIIGGLFFPYTIQALDTTIVAGALPFIASDFNELAQLDWIVLAFNLTSATFIPAWGQIADVYGRYASVQASIILMLLGSALCAGSPTSAFPMLLFGRAILGMGCAGMNISTRTILADKVSLKENARNTTIFQMVGGLGYGLGPTIGGYLTQVSWRWVFIINCPLGVIGLFTVHFLLRDELVGPKRIIRSDGIEDDRSPTFFRRLLTIDLGGQFLFLFGLGLLLLALSWGGSYYSWADVKVLAPLVIGLILLTCFLTYEYFMVPGRSLANKLPRQRAMIPFKILATRNASILLYINFITGMAMYATMYFAVLFFTLVLNFEPGQAGLGVIYYIPGLAIGVYMAMFILNVWPRETFVSLSIGTLIEPIGMTLLAHALSTEIPAYIYCMIGLTGIGTGIRLMPGSLHAVGYYRSHIATMMSSIMLASSMGGALGLSIMDNIFNSRVSKAGFDLDSSNFGNLGSIGSLDPATAETLKDTAKRGIIVAYYAITAFMWLGLVLMLGIGNLKIGKKAKKGSGKEDIPDRIWEGSYIIGKVTRRNRWREAETEAIDPHYAKSRFEGQEPSGAQIEP